MLVAAGAAAASPALLWNEIGKGQLADARLEASPEARAFSVDLGDLEIRLRAKDERPAVELSLPRPGGGAVTLYLEPTATMAPELARQHPDILTFAGRGVGPEVATTARMTWSRLGFTVWVREAEGSFFIEPIDAAAGMYVSYRPEAAGAIDCGAGLADVIAHPAAPPAAKAATDAIDVLRLAVAATSEFTQNVAGGSSTIALLTIIATINQINGILEPEARVRLQLIPETTELIYVAPNDPYTDISKEAMQGENQANLEDVIGLDAFDIGHVFSWAAVGGIAAGSSVCIDDAKARGASGWEPSSLRWIQIVAHEISHHLGASHSFNSTSGLCRGQRSVRTAWEAGSGTSLMSYAGSGRCFPEEVSSVRLSRLHSGSRDEIRERIDFVTSALGCGTKSQIVNTDPAVVVLSERPLPAWTPFRLRALAADSDGDDLIFCWEQRDVGSASPSHLDDGARPLFAVECGSADDRAGTLHFDSRAFPERASLLRGAIDDVGQTLPTTDRELRIGVSVRDDKGGFAEAQTVVEVTSQAGPFRITSPSGFAIWDRAVQIVRWDVAGTTAPPVSCSKVDILLSVDGGLTFPTSLLPDTANDGIAWISLPSIWTTRGRIEVRCSNHVFFDVSDSNIWIRTRTF